MPQNQLNNLFMGCVNRSTKEFKVLAEHNGVSVEKLELITHKYWMESATEDYFPSEVYIKAQLGEIPYEEKARVSENCGSKVTALLRNSIL